MQHLHDYGYAPTAYTNDPFTSSTRPTHVSPSHSLNEMAPAPFFPNTPFGYHTNTHVVSDPRLSTLQIRLPLAPTLGFTSDFQASASRAGHSSSSWRLPVDDDKSSAQTYGSGMRPQPSLAYMGSLPVPVSVSVPLPDPLSLAASYMAAPHALMNDWNPSFSLHTSAPLSLASRQHELETSTSSLQLEDICYLESVEDRGFMSGSGSCTSATSESASPMLLDQPYSECPAADFSAPEWSLPRYSPPSSYCSLSGSDGSLSTSPKKEPEDDYFCFSPELATDDGFGSAPLLGLFADVNMRELAVDKRSPSVCVNPADVMGYMSKEPTPEPDCEDSPDVSSRSSTGHSTPVVSLPEASMDQQLSQTPDFTSDFSEDVVVKDDFAEDAISAIVSVLKSSVKQEIQDPMESITEETLPQYGSIQQCELVAPQPLYPNQIPGYPNNSAGVHHPSLAYGSGCGSAPFPGPRMPLVDIQLQQIQQIHVPQFGEYSSFTLPPAYGALPPAPVTPAPPVAHAAPAPLIPSSPVLNAHTGIELDDLRRRAADFRLRNPNSELDRSFLQCFAGRLSDRGELLDEYRCYVVGCGQRNKRRDHILVHVGSHVEHRPWQCKDWYALFSYTRRISRICVC